ncbi:MAG: IclR family transcriptional regulator [Alphaproteobacteria bacterium]|jgi:DNA-binding IclR family transcriptional regulator|nr:IclR family transcriptional regulator [Alphaproteobacteria bacterium]
MSSLETAVSILKCFSAETPELAVNEVSRQLDLPKSTVSRLLRAMAEQGLVEQDPESRRFSVGPLPFRLGRLYHARIKVLDLVEQELAALVEETGFTGYVGVMNGQDIVILRKRHGDYPVQMVLEPGFRAAAASTAFGKALLARMDDAAMAALVPPVLVNERTGITKTSEAIIAEVAEVRRRGWALAHEAFPDMAAIGAAVGSDDDQPAVGFALSFPRKAIEADAMTRFADRLVAIARSVAAKTGDPFWMEAKPASQPAGGKREGARP